MVVHVPWFVTTEKTTRTNLVFVNERVFFLLVNSTPGTHDFARSRMISIVVIAYFQVSHFNRRAEDQFMRQLSHSRSGQGNTYNLHFGNTYNIQFGQASPQVTKE